MRRQVEDIRRSRVIGPGDRKGTGRSGADAGCVDRALRLGRHGQQPFHGPSRRGTYEGLSLIGLALYALRPASK